MKTSLGLNEKVHAVTESHVLTLATSIMEERLTKLSCVLSSPDIVRDYVKFKLGLREREVAYSGEVEHRFWFKLNSLFPNASRGGVLTQVFK